ncbi:MAG: type II secretion system protein GspG [Kiritimatiellae bacterium]|nr:type II secretion system protein GspG [Kiritimatiellia bacterium]
MLNRISLDRFGVRTYSRGETESGEREPRGEMRRIGICFMAIGIAAIGSSCGEKAPVQHVVVPQKEQVPRIALNEYTEICALVRRFHAAVEAGDIKTLRRVSPLVAFSIGEGVVDLQPLARSFAQQRGEAGNVQHVIPGAGDALAFTTASGTAGSVLWYYVQQHDNGNWVVQFCEDWEAANLPELFDECRAATRKAAAAQGIRNIEKVLITFTRDCGALPSETEGLGALLDDPGIKGWNGPYLHLEALIDPWGTAFQYRRIDGQARITSAGDDRKPGTEDDVQVPQK